MKNNLFSKFPLLTFAAILLTSCAALQPAKSTLPPLRVGFTQRWGDYALLVAQEQGYFAEYRVEVEPAYYPTPDKVYSDLAAGQIDAAFITVGDALNVNRYAPIKIIGLEDNGGYAPIVARPEIQAIQDLQGKTVGIPAGTQYELLLTEMLASAGMSAADVTIRNVPPEKVPAALAKNEIQAGFTWEPFASQTLRAGARALYPADDAPRLFPNVIVFRKSLIDQRPEEIRAFMQAWFKAVDYSAKNAEETRRIAAQYTGISVEQIQPDPRLQIYAYADNINLFSEISTEADSVFAIAQKTADYLVSSGILSVMPDIQEIVMPNFLSQPK